MSSQDDGGSSSSEETDVDLDPLDQLQQLGFAGGEAMDALMQCGGDLGAAKAMLTASSSNSNRKSSANDAAPNNSRRNKKQKDRKNKQQPQNDSAAAPRNSNNNNKSFKDQRKQELRFQKALRDQRRVCRVCGGPHPRNECPGIADDGRGHSRHSDTRTRKKEIAKRKEFEAQKRNDDEFLELGRWTAHVPYYDGFADLVQAFQCPNNGAACASSNRHRSTSFDGNDKTDHKEGRARWILDWATRSVQLGEDPIHQLTPEQRKLELKTWAGSRLQKTARALSQDNDAVDTALKDRNPRSALIQIIISAAATAADQDDAPERSLANEWPGYRGCVAPFSVLNADAMHALEQLHELGSSSRNATHNNNGVKALLSIPPLQVAQWMVVVNSSNNAEEADSSTAATATNAVPIDLCYFTREAEELKTTQAATKRAQEQLVVASAHKKGRASAEAEVMRLRKVLAGQRARQVDAQEVLEGAAQARLNPIVLTSLDDRMELHRLGVVVGISCGLNYDCAEARHPVLGEAVRGAQKAACKHAIEAAVKEGLPIVLECQDTAATKIDTLDTDPFPTAIPLASSDLVRIMVEAAPPETTLLLRNGSLTVAPKPGIQQLLCTWPKLYLGVTSALAFSKCPKELLDVIYDVPSFRICLLSEAPLHLPPVLSGSHLVDDCLPPHVACISETVNSIKNESGTSREEVLRTSTQLISRIFGLPEPE